MPCFKPLQGWMASTLNKSGKRGVVFSPSKGFRDMPVEVPCGRCMGCRLERARQWSVRLMHEKTLHPYAWFLTLTYSDENLPEGMSLLKSDVQKFLKRLRKAKGKCRYLYCGEYGDTTFRPHYHMILYGLDFPDRKVIKRKENGDLYESEELKKLWGLGHVWLGAVSYESAGYVARYVTKKVTGDKAEAHYRWVHPETGEVYNRLPEFIDMSRRPGIGQGWFEKYASDVYPSDSVIVRGKETKPPRYYDRKLENESPAGLKRIKNRRIRAALAKASDNTPDRLQVKEECLKARTKILKRDAI